jgi:integrase
MKKLTDADVKSLKAPEHGRIELRDSDVRGLAIRVTERGAKSWVLWYWNPAAKRKRRLTLGEYPAISLAKARELARKHKNTIAEGGDPAVAKQIATTQQAPKTVGEAMALYVEESKRNKQRSWKNKMWLARKHLLPVWRSRLLQDITRANVVELLNRIARAEHRGRPTKGTAANRVASLLSGLFSWAISQALCDVNPVRDTRRPTEEQPREFTLPGDQVRKIWRVVKTLEDARVRDFYRLTFLTCGRRGEVLGMRWDDLDLDEGVWTVPRARTKNKQVWRVPLTSTALSLLRERKAASTSDFVLAGGGGLRDGLLKREALFKHHRKLLRLLDAAGVNYRSAGQEDEAPLVFRGHDCRGLCATHLGARSFPEAVIDRVLNQPRAASRDGTTITTSTFKSTATRSWTGRTGSMESSSEARLYPSFRRLQPRRRLSRQVPH